MSACSRDQLRQWPGTLLVEDVAAAMVSAALLLATGRSGRGLRTRVAARFTDRPRVRSADRETVSRRTTGTDAAATGSSGAARTTGVGAAARWPATTAVVATTSRASAVSTQAGMVAARFIKVEDKRVPS